MGSVGLGGMLDCTVQPNCGSVVEDMSPNIGGEDCEGF